MKEFTDKIKYKGGMALMMAMLFLLPGFLYSCSNDSNEEIEPENPYVPKESYYIRLDVVASDNGTTRSATTPEGGSDDGVVNATDNENSLKSASVYFCVGNEVKASFTSSGYINQPDKDGHTSLYCKIANLQALTDLAGEKVNIVVVGNTENIDGFSHNLDNSKNISTAKFPISGVNSRPLGNYGENGLMMPLVSADNFYVTMPGDPDTDSAEEILEMIKGLFSERTPNNVWWNLEDDKNNSTLKLERAVARLEYRGIVSEDGEEDKKNIFRVGDLENVNVKLYSVTPFNIADETYLFKHTMLGDDDSAFSSGNDLTVFGSERGTVDGAYNWVASPWWGTGNGTPSLINKLNVSDHLYTIAGTPLELDIAEVQARGMSEALSGNGKNAKGGYHPMCYVSENTLYNTDIMSDLDVMNYATGVAFKFRLLNTDDKEINVKDETTWKFPLQIDWNPEEGMGNPNDKTGNQGHLNITDLKTWEWVDVAPDPVDGYYYLTFVGFIVHNAPLSAEIAPMFYGVVRNNSYQISIGKIAGLPNPRDPRSCFLKLDINVLNWDSRDVGFDF